MIPILAFETKTCSVARPTRTDAAHTLHHNIGWADVSGMSSVPISFQPRGQRPFGTDVGIIYDEAADAWIDSDNLPSGGAILTGDRLTISSVVWDVVSAELIEQGGIDRHYRLSLRKVQSA